MFLTVNIQIFMAAAFVINFIQAYFTNVPKMVVPDKHIQHRLMFAGKTEAYPSEVPFRCPLLGKLLPFP
jgi:hypothetical protein